MSKIVTIEQQQHFLKTLPELFDTLTIPEITAIADRLGLANIIQDGQLVPMYSVQIKSNADKVLDMETFVSLELEGNLYNYFSITDASVYHWTRDSGNAEADARWNKFSKKIIITSEDITENIYARDISYTLSVTVNGETYSDTITFSITSTFNKVQLISNSSIFVGGSPAEINFTSRLYGTIPVSYRWYLNDVLVGTANNYSLSQSAVEVGTSAKVSVEITDPKGKIHTDTISIPKVASGKDGEPGVPGPPGEDGSARYTHIKYADDESGTNMSEYPHTGGVNSKEYIGIAENQTSPIKSNNPEDYVWSRYIGPEGIPGESGYMWIKYSEFSGGRNEQGNVSMRDDTYDPVKEEYMVYMGIAYNKVTKTESNIPEDYTWTKIKGDDGHTGYVLDLSNENQQIPTDSDGNLAGEQSLIGAETSITLYYGNTPLASNRWSVDAVASDSGLTYRIDTLTTHRQLIVTGYDTDNMIDYIDISVRLSGNVIKQARFTLTKSINAATYSLIPSVSSIKVSSDGIISPNKLSFKVLKNTGISIVETNEATVTYKYDFNTGDGTPIPNGTELSLSNSGNPNSIQLMLYHPETNILVDREDIPFVRDGSKGDKGDPGIQGAPGSPGIDGAIPLTHEWVSGTTYYNGQARKDYVYYRVTNTWYKIKDGVTSAVAGASPDGNWVIASEMKNVVLGEMLNVGGWIISNNKLFSQAGLVLDSSGRPLYSNIVLSGTTGEIIMGNNRAVFDKDSLSFKDTQGRDRIVIELDSSEVPAIFFKNAEGLKTWEAGKDGYKLITQGTRPPEWRETKHRLIDTNENASFHLRMYATSDPNGPASLPTGNERQPMFLQIVAESNLTPSYLLSSKGDIAANQNIYVAYYNSRTYIQNGEAPSPVLLPNGWYILDYVGGSMLPEDMEYGSNYTKYSSYVTAHYMKDGVSIKTQKNYVSEYYHYYD